VSCGSCVTDIGLSFLEILLLFFHGFLSFFCMSLWVGVDLGASRRQCVLACYSQCLAYAQVQRTPKPL
jgi:hypothetical protein